MRHRRTAGLCLTLVLALAALAWVFVGRAQAATIVVNTTADENGACDPQGCSLREAISVAAPGDEITFSSLFNSVQTIRLQNGEIVIEKNLTITGPANLVVVSGNNQSRILRVRSGFTVNINNMIFANGNGVGATTDTGGAILTQGSVTLTRCQLVGNRSSRGGAIFNAAGGNLTLVESSVDLNTSTNRGGGISSNTTLTVLRSTIIGNTAQGGITGGGIDASGTLNVINSTITNNRVTNSSGPNAGGIFVSGSSSTATIVNSTITQNFVASDSHTGGIHRDDGTVTLRNTIVAANQVPPPPAQANASEPNEAGAFASAESNGQNAADVGGSLVSAAGGGNNLIGIVGAAIGLANGVNGDQVGGGPNPPLNAGLNPSPKNNGGPTKTHSLKEGSLAENAGNDCVKTANGCGDNNPAIPSDQTGAPRVGQVDIGSVERGDAPTPCTYTVSPLSFSVPAAGDSRTVNIDTQAGCAWEAGENEPLSAAYNPRRASDREA
jgi:CSLREA domain-containing protein